MVAVEDEQDPPYPDYLRRTVHALMGRQLLRPGGIAGLLSNVFGLHGANPIMQSRSSDAPGEQVLELHKLDHVTRLISMPAQGMTPEEYFDNVYHQLCLVVVPRDATSAQNIPRHHSRAAAYVLTRLAVTRPPILSLLERSLHRPLLAPNVNNHLSMENEVVTSAESVNTLLSLLLPLLTLNPPTPPLLHALITPILRPLYLLWQHMQKDKTADSLTGEELGQAVASWIRLINLDQVEKTMWSIIVSGRGWHLAGAGDVLDDRQVLYWDHTIEDVTGQTHTAVFHGTPPERASQAFESATSVESAPRDVLTRPSNMNTTDRPEHSTSPKDNEASLDLSGLDVYPDPALFVKLLTLTGRTELSAAILFRCLQAYQESALKAPPVSAVNSPNTNVVLGIMLRLTQNASIFPGNHVQDVLNFIEHALRSPGNAAAGHVHDDSTIDDEDMADSDGGDGDIPNQGLVETALSLLLTTVSADSTVTQTTYPILQVIESQVDRLLTHQQAQIRQLAKEASSALAVCKAAPSTPTNAGTMTRTECEHLYQEALKLLQDPVLAVRGHGLILLQDLVTHPEFDHVALTPAIMDIFLSALRDDDSFMYLNAIKGLGKLAAIPQMSKQVFGTLVRAYMDGLDRAEGNVSTNEMDRKLRLGEALQQSIRQCGLTMIANGE